MQIYIVESVFNSIELTNSVCIEGCFKHKKDACICLQQLYEREVRNDKYYHKINIYKDPSLDMIDYVYASDNKDIPEYSIELNISVKELL